LKIFERITKVLWYVVFIQLRRFVYKQKTKGRYRTEKPWRFLFSENQFCSLSVWDLLSLIPWVFQSEIFTRHSLLCYWVLAEIWATNSSHNICNKCCMHPCQHWVKCSFVCETVCTNICKNWLKKYKKYILHLIKVHKHVVRTNKIPLVDLYRKKKDEMLCLFFVRERCWDYSCV